MAGLEGVQHIRELPFHLVRLIRHERHGPLEAFPEPGSHNFSSQQLLVAPQPDVGWVGVGVLGVVGIDVDHFDDRDIGSLEVGKLGDLIVFNADPLINIRNTADIQDVMKGGVLYDASSLDELWPRARRFGDYDWVVPDVYRADTRPVDYFDHQR